MMTIGTVYKSLLIIVLSFANLHSQSLYNHPELEWHSFETDHFIFHFHDGTENSAREAASVAEHIYHPITEYYDYKPKDKTHIILKDTDDYANGAAYSFDNKIEIWAMPLAFDLRGAHRWLQNVITHEFTHIIQIQSSIKFSQNIPGSFFQFIGYEKKKRADVLYGYPDRIISWPLPGVVVPPWLAEGTAQYMYPGANFDFWDSHRDMILRDKVLNNNLLSFSEMNSFGKRGTGNESTYNQGFAFVTWLTSVYGEETPKNITNALARPFQYSIQNALKKVTGTNGNDLYDTWALELSTDYNNKVKSIVENEQKGEILEDKGTTNLYPVWSPNTEMFAFISNRDHDYFGQTDLYIKNMENEESKKIAGRVESAATWINNSHILYSRRSKPNKNGSVFFDLYRYDLNLEEETRLTTNGRFMAPLYIAKENKVAAIKTIDGSSNIYTSDLDYIDFQPITDISDGTVFFSLTYDENNKSLIADGNTNHGRQLYSVSVETGEVTRITSSDWDSRHPDIKNDLEYFSQDKSGIFNLVEKDGGHIRNLTNVTGGAFMPDVADDGRILYSLYENGSYKIALLNNPESIDDKWVGYQMDYHSTWPKIDVINEKDQTPAAAYEETMSTLFIMPRMMVDYEEIKPGVYFYAGEILNRMNFMGGVSMNRLKDKDLFALIEYRKWKPTFYVNLFGIVRNRYDNKFLIYNLQEYDSRADLRFTIFAVDAGFRFPFKSHKLNVQYSYQNYKVNQRWTHIGGLGETLYPSGYGWEYFLNHSLSLKGMYSKKTSQFLRTMLPSSGYAVNYTISYDDNNFLSGFKEDQLSTEIYSPEHTYRVEIEADKHVKINKKLGTTGSIIGNAAWLSNQEIDDFFHFFGGGLPGLKGYTYYESTLSGPNLALTTIKVRQPLFTEKSFSSGPFIFQNMSVGFIGQVGGGFSGKIENWVKSSKYGRSIGAELRLSGFSFYSYPTAIAYETHFSVDLDLNISAPKHYFTLLFDFME